MIPSTGIVNLSKAAAPWEAGKTESCNDRAKFLSMHEISAPESTRAGELTGGEEGKGDMNVIVVLGHRTRINFTLFIIYIVRFFGAGYGDMSCTTTIQTQPICQPVLLLLRGQLARDRDERDSSLGGTGRHGDGANVHWHGSKC